MNEASEIVFCIPSLNHHFGGFLFSQDMILWLTLLEEIVRGIVRAKIDSSKKSRLVLCLPHCSFTVGCIMINTG